MDESGLFWKVVPNRGLVPQGERCKGGKLAKERLTITFLLFSSEWQVQASGDWQISDATSFQQTTSSASHVEGKRQVLDD